MVSITKRQLASLILGCALITAPLAMHAQGLPEQVSGLRFEAKLASLQDGDSFIAQSPFGRVSIRLSGVDAPERDQAYSAQARAQMQQLLQGRQLSITVLKKDQYQRLVADVSVVVEGKTLDVGLEQIKAGLSWHFKRFAKEQAFETRLAFTRAEEKAREQRLGLWKDLDGKTPPEAPWDFRRRKRQGKSEQAD
jgi:endonuclease YncB( thermonuclease family)